MGGFLVRRLTWAVVVMLAVAVTAFLLIFVAPGDPAKAIAGTNSNAEAVERVRQALGLDRPPIDSWPATSPAWHRATWDGPTSRAGSRSVT